MSGNGNLTGTGTNNPTKLFIPQKNEMPSAVSTMARVLETFINNLNAPSPSASGVTQIVAGTGVTISPSSGTGAVTINASGGSSGPWQSGSGTDSAQLIGSGSLANGNYSVAEGHNNTSGGASSHTEGQQNSASGDYSHAEGNITSANSVADHAEGYHTVASGGYSHAEGYFSASSGGYSHAEGSSTASGTAAHAEGFQTTSSGSASHSEGENTTATGEASHAEGLQTTATGRYSHAAGFATFALNDQSTALGLGSLAYSPSQVALSGVAFGSNQQGRAQLSFVSVGAQMSQNATLVIFNDYAGSALYTRTAFFDLRLVARDSSGTSSGWTFQGLLKGSAGAYAWFTPTPTFTLFAQDAGASGWTPSITISTNTIVVTVSGASGSNTVFEVGGTLNEVFA